MIDERMARIMVDLATRVRDVANRIDDLTQEIADLSGRVAAIERDRHARLIEQAQAYTVNGR